MAPAQPRRRLDAALIAQFVKYGIVGASNTALTFLTYTVLVELVGVEYLVALLAGYVVGGVNSYVFNRHWTFKAGHIPHTRAGSRFALITALAAAANELLLYAFVHGLHVEKIGAQAILTVPMLCITFAANRYWSFSAGEHELAPAQSK
jgi:putative flippase GtrA